jgi:hypothetical protein
MQVNETVTGFCGVKKQFTTKNGGHIKPSFSGPFEEVKLLYQTLEKLTVQALPFKAEKKAGHDYVSFSVGNMVFSLASYGVSSASFQVYTPEKYARNSHELLAA